MSPKIQAFMLAAHKLVTEAETKFNVNLTGIKITCDIRGYRLAGQGGIKKGKMLMRFHPLAIEKYYDEMVNETLPHELAHVITMVKHKTCLHDRDFRYYCKRLGGNADTLHTMHLGTRAEAKAKQKQPSKKYEFRCENGETIVLGLGRYNSLRLGKIKYYECARRGKIYWHDLIGRVQ